MYHYTKKEGIGLMDKSLLQILFKAIERENSIRLH